MPSSIYLITLFTYWQEQFGLKIQIHMGGWGGIVLSGKGGENGFFSDVEQFVKQLAALIKFL